MSHIEKLVAKEIGIFKDLEVEFSPDVNIIIGDNASGKTSLLKAIVLSCSSIGRDISKAFRYKKESAAYIYINRDNERLRMGYDRIVNKEGAYQNPSEISPYFNTNHKEKLHNITQAYPATDKLNLYAIGASRVVSYKKIGGMKEEPSLFRRRQLYQGSNINYLERTDLPDIKQWLINRYFIVGKDWATDEGKNWNYWLERLAQITPEDMELSFNRIERDLEPIFTINGNECYLEELSSGIKSVLAIVFSIIDWIEGTNEGEAALIQHAEGTVLIDEIDAHLHPSWQRVIMTKLREFFPKIQFIVTTHSPLVIASADERELIKIPSNHDGVLRLKPAENKFSGWRMQYLLEDLMQVRSEYSEELEAILEGLDNALDNNNRAVFDAKLEELRNIVHQNDSILKVYEIQSATLALTENRNDNDTNR